MAYEPAFHGGVHVTVADVTGDFVPDVITAPGPGGGPVVRIWDGATGAMVRQFAAYDPNFRGGVWLATARTCEQCADRHRYGGGARRRTARPRFRCDDGARSASSWPSIRISAAGSPSPRPMDSRFTLDSSRDRSSWGQAPAEAPLSAFSLGRAARSTANFWLTIWRFAAASTWR